MKSTLQKDLNKRDIVTLLNSHDEEQKFLFDSAFKLRKDYFDYEIYPRGVLEISNHCQLNCHYCGMRKDNKGLVRYRMKWKEILDTALLMQTVGMKSIMLQSGDDYSFPIKELENIIHAIRKETDLHIILCLGERKKTDLEKLLEAGANMYILKLETINPDLFSKLRPKTTFQKRLNLLRFMKEIGYEISSGFIVGLPGQTVDELAEGLLLLKEIQVDNASISPFIPNDGSPLMNEPLGDLELSLNMVALMRIILGKINIPSVSAFSVLANDGQIRAFQAGANVLTINFSPTENLRNYLIYSSTRKIVSLEKARQIVLESGLISSILEKKLHFGNTFLRTPIESDYML